MPFIVNPKRELNIDSRNCETVDVSAPFFMHEIGTHQEVEENRKKILAAIIEKGFDLEKDIYVFEIINLTDIWPIHRFIQQKKDLIDIDYEIKKLPAYVDGVFNKQHTECKSCGAIYEIKIYRRYCAYCGIEIYETKYRLKLKQEYVNRKLMEW